VYKLADIEDSMDEQPLVISHDIVIFSDCTWTFHVHGNQVDSSICSSLATVPIILNPESFLAFLKLVDELNVCTGQPNPHFVALLQKKSNEILSSDGSRSAYIDEKCYPVIVRTLNYEILTNKEKCMHCKEYRATLRTLCNRILSASSAACSSHTNDRYACGCEYI